MNGPWYSWLSIIGFTYQFARTAYRILIGKRPFNFELWVRFIGKTLGLFFGLLVLPSAILLIIMDAVFSVNHFIGYVVNGIILLYIYFAGVWTTRNLFQWSKKQQIF